MKKTNKELIVERIQKLVKETGVNFSLGCWDKNIEKISKKELKKVIDSIYGDSTDVDVYIRKKLYVLQISVVDNEIDFNLLTQEEYISRYGDERWEE